MELFAHVLVDQLRATPNVIQGELLPEHGNSQPVRGALAQVLGCNDHRESHARYIAYRKIPMILSDLQTTAAIEGKPRIKLSLVSDRCSPKVI